MRLEITDQEIQTRVYSPRAFEPDDEDTIIKRILELAINGDVRLLKLGWTGGEWDSPIKNEIELRIEGPKILWADHVWDLHAPNSLQEVINFVAQKLLC